MATKSTPDGVDLKLSNYSTSANHGGGQLRSQDGGGPAISGHSGEDHAAGGRHQGGQRSPGGRHRRSAGLQGLQASKADASALTDALLSEADSKVAAALLGAVTTAALKAALAGKAGASALLDTPLEVDTKIANALLGLATEAFVAAQLASRDASVSALQGAKADTSLLASYATNAALSASDAPERPRRNPRGARRPADLEAPLSAALANGDDTLTPSQRRTRPLRLRCWPTTPPHKWTRCWETTKQERRRTRRRRPAITAALLAYYTSPQVDALLRLPHGERAGHADA